jgi:hypothetical protein
VQSNILTPSFIPLGSETVHGADPSPTPVQHVGIDHRRLHVPMPEQFLNGADIVAIFQEMSGERMAQRVAAGRLGRHHVSRGLFNSSLSHRFMQMMSPALAGPRVQAGL